MPSVQAQEKNSLQYTINFANNTEALPSLADLDSLKVLAKHALSTDTHTVILRRFVDYWVQDDAYYVLTRKRSYLLQQIFKRAGIEEHRVAIETIPLSNLSEAATMRHRIDVFVAAKLDSIQQEALDTLAEEEVNYYGEIRQLLWQLISDKEQVFYLNPNVDTILYTRQGAAIVHQAKSFAVPAGTELLELHLYEAFQKSDLLILQLASLWEKEQLREWEGALYLEAKLPNNGPRVSLRKDQELLLALPTADLHTNMRLCHSVNSPKSNMRWLGIEMGYWKPTYALSLNLAESDSLNLYFCNRIYQSKPQQPQYPEKLEKPTLEKPNPIALAQQDSNKVLIDGFIKTLEEEQATKLKAPFQGKKKKAVIEEQYAREIETMLAKKADADAQKAAIIAAVNQRNAVTMAAYQKRFDQYNHLRDSLQQAHLQAVFDWHAARDSLIWLCEYEKAQVDFLKQRYPDSLFRSLKQGLANSPFPNTQSPIGKKLFPLGKQHLFIATRQLGWLSLQRLHPYEAEPLHYKVFTHSELPTFKVIATALLRNSRSQAMGKAEDSENVAFYPLPAEDKIWVLALYIEDGKPMLALHTATANRLPQKLVFERIENMETLRSILDKINH